LKSSYISVLITIFTLLFLLTLPTVLADRGGIPLGSNILPSSIYESGQKAIIAWNGTEEILILSTDLHADETMMVLEILPLPSNPKIIKKASDMAFTRAQSIVYSHAPKVFSFGYFRQLGGFGETAVPASIEITFHEKIGAHDIAVARPQNLIEFANWIETFLRDNDITEEASLQNFETILGNYIASGYNYFVLDIIELSQTRQSVEPIYYEFETSSLYYPLKISSKASGETKITLFLVTREAIDELHCFPFRYAYYGSSPSIMNPIIMFTINEQEIKSIDENILSLFSNHAWFTVLQYSGLNSALTKDLALSVWMFRLSYLTLFFRAVLRYMIAALPIEIGIGLFLLSIATKPAFRKEISVFLR